MIFKVYYQAAAERNPKREDTKVLYFEAADMAEARAKAETTTYNVEFIESLSKQALAYEEQNANYKLTKI